MGTLTLPTPVALAGGALCVLGGYLLGTVGGPDTPSRTTGVVDSYDPSAGRLCLHGDAVSDQQGASQDGRLCGTWRRSVGDEAVPRSGEQFRFVSVVGGRPSSGGARSRGPAPMIYGEVVP